MMYEWRNNLTAHDAIMGILGNTAFMSILEPKREYTGEEVANIYIKNVAPSTAAAQIECKINELVLRWYVAKMSVKPITHHPTGYIRTDAKHFPLRLVYESAKQILINS